MSTAGGPARARYEQLLAMAEPLARQVGQPHAQAMITLARTAGAAHAGRVEKRLYVVRPGRGPLAQCTGVAWELDTVHNLCLWGLVHRGDLNAVRRRWPAS